MLTSVNNESELIFNSSTNVQKTSVEGANADHEVALNAIIAGLVEGHSASRLGYWLHTGGTGILTYYEQDRFGQPPSREYDDVDGLDVIAGIPSEAFHAVSDGIVRDAGTKHADAVKAAIVCPPTIYGMYSVTIY